MPYDASGRWYNDEDTIGDRLWDNGDQPLDEDNISQDSGGRGTGGRGIGGGGSGQANKSKYPNDWIRAIMEKLWDRYNQLSDPNSKLYRDYYSKLGKSLGSSLGTNKYLAGASSELLGGRGNTLAVAGKRRRGDVSKIFESAREGTQDFYKGMEGARQGIMSQLLQGHLGQSGIDIAREGADFDISDSAGTAATAALLFLGKDDPQTTQTGKATLIGNLNKPKTDTNINWESQSKYNQYGYDPYKKGY